MISEEKFPVEVSKTNVKSLWERGGGCKHCGESVVICDSEGKRKSAIFVTMPTVESECGKHALVPIDIGDYVISVVRWRNDIDILAYQIINVPNKTGEYVEFDELETYEFDKHSYNDQDYYAKYYISHLFSVVQAAVKKAFRYHCNEAVYIVNPKKWVDYARSIGKNV